MKLTFLGTGTSFGVPQLGCQLRGVPVARSARHAHPRRRGGRERRRHASPDRHAAGAAAAAHRGGHRSRRRGAVHARARRPHARHRRPARDHRAPCRRRCRSTDPRRRSSDLASEVPATSSTTASAAARDVEAEGRARPSSRGETFAIGDVRRHAGRGAARRLSPSLRTGSGRSRTSPTRSRFRRRRSTCSVARRVLVINALFRTRASDAPQHSRSGRARRARIGAERTYLTHLTHDNFHAELEARAAARGSLRRSTGSPSAI